MSGIRHPLAASLLVKKRRPSDVAEDEEEDDSRGANERGDGAGTSVERREGGDVAAVTSTSGGDVSGGGDDDDVDDDGDEDEDDDRDAGESESSDDEEEEPHFKLSSLTKDVPSLYRRNDATCCFLTAGDKMIVGTHSGSIHVISMPSLDVLRVYRPHSASVTSISISPFPSARPNNAQSHDTHSTSSPMEFPGLRRAPTLASTSPSLSPFTARSQRSSPSSQSSSPVYIASSSVDGNVCVVSLTDPKDIILRNFGRPVQTVALSPNYRQDRTFLSGGLAGSLIVTVGGRVGAKSNATILEHAVTNPSTWLGSLGLTTGNNIGSDSVLHGGEGLINAVKWSLSGRFVAWVNEEGIKIMRSNMHLDAADAELAWTRIGHIDRPTGAAWDEMAGVWKARAQWLCPDFLELDDDEVAYPPGVSHAPATPSSEPEKLVVGWGSTIWFINVSPASGADVLSEGKKCGGIIEVTNILRTDSIISGISFYTPKLVLVLAYLARSDDDDDNNNDNNKHNIKGKRAAAAAGREQSRRGIRHKRNGLPPELRLIDVETKAQVSTETLDIPNHESLSFFDYHLDILPPVRNPAPEVPKGPLESLWDATMNPSRLLNSAASIRSTVTMDMSYFSMRRPYSFTQSRGAVSNASPGPPAPASAGGAGGADSAASSAASVRAQSPSGAGAGVGAEPREPTATATAASAPGIKVLVHSPYDCVLAVKRDASDRLAWLQEHENYEAAWELLGRYPEAVVNKPGGAAGAASDWDGNSATTPTSLSGVTTPKTSHPALDSMSESQSMTISSPVRGNSIVEKERQHIGEQWVNQLLAEHDWASAGKVCGKVLVTAARWEHYISLFIRNDKYDEIAYQMPTTNLEPLLPSSIYEDVLIHYVALNRTTFKELLELWPLYLFDSTSVTRAIEEQMELVELNGEEWQMMMKSLAKLYLAGGRYRGALKCYIKLGDADTAMALIRQHHLLDAIAEDIPALILLRVPRDKISTATQEELQAASSEVIDMLVSAAAKGILSAQDVIQQLQESKLDVFVYFYIKAFWEPNDANEEANDHRRRFARNNHFHHHFQQQQQQHQHRHPSQRPQSDKTASSGSDFQGELRVDQTRALIDDFADTAIDIFASYNRDLLMDFLQTNTAYSYGHASLVCEQRHYTPELIYLFSKTGATKRALYLILSDPDTGDVSRAIAFAKEQDDPDLWEDLLAYSMDKPSFIRGLLAEAGTAIDPISLVRRIPSGLEIEGLREGLARLIREYDIQASISEGVARVLVGEVVARMDALRKSQRRGIKFEIAVAPEERGVAGDGGGSTDNGGGGGGGSGGVNAIDRSANGSDAARQAERRIPPILTPGTTTTAMTSASTRNASSSTRGQKGVLNRVSSGFSSPTHASASSTSVPGSGFGFGSGSAAAAAGTGTSGCCAGCLGKFREHEKETLVGFACGHVFHLSHLDRVPRKSSQQASVSEKLRSVSDGDGDGEDGDEAEETEGHRDSENDDHGPFSLTDEEDEEDEGSAYQRTIGPKVTMARLLRDRIGSGCRICARRRLSDDDDHAAGLH